jgi:hypothetical protein
MLLLQIFGWGIPAVAMVIPSSMHEYGYLGARCWIIDTSEYRGFQGRVMGYPNTIDTKVAHRVARVVCHSPY